MQIFMQKSKVYLIFYVFLSKILSIFTINTTHGRLTEPPALFLCTLYLVTWSLYQRTLRIINLVTAEDEDSAVTEKNIMPLQLNAKSSLLMEEEYLSSLHYIADYSLINAHAMKDYIGLYKMRDFLR